MNIFKTLLLGTILVVSCMVNANAEQDGSCSKSYKSCVSNLLDHYDAYSKAYDKHPAECKKNLKEWAKSDYDFAYCLDDFRLCNGKNIDVWQRMQTSPVIDFVKGDPNEYGLTTDELVELKKNANEIDNLQSLLISQKGELLHESYYAFKDDPKPQRINSITKSVMSILIGIAIDKGYIESEDSPIKPYFNEYYSNNKDERKDQITIKHALTMTTGINLSDQTYYYNHAERWIQYLRDDNAYDWILNTEMLMSYKPGDTWMYNTMNVDLLSSIISAETDMTTLEFAKKYLFEPLGIENYVWLHDSKENYYGGFGIYLRPRALIRIGEMVLNKGIYASERIVSEEWINKSHYHHYPLGGEEGWEYGYLWWKHRMNNKQVISALGYAGQVMALVPSLDLVIVTTVDSNVCSAKEQDEQFWAAMNLVEDVIQKMDN